MKYLGWKTSYTLIELLMSNFMGNTLKFAPKPISLLPEQPVITVLHHRKKQEQVYTLTSL